MKVDRKASLIQEHKWLGHTRRTEHWKAGLPMWDYQVDMGF
jgi:hypothetical protein